MHLAAQAGVRYSLDHPDKYTRNNVNCFARLLETMVDLGLDEEGALIYA
jgi:nucleoside-diphosphate-sugar epimerase